MASNDSVLPLINEAVARKECFVATTGMQRLGDIIKNIEPETLRQRIGDNQTHVKFTLAENATFEHAQGISAMCAICFALSGRATCTNQEFI